MNSRARPYKDSTEMAQLPEMEAELPSVESVCQKLDSDLAASSALKVYLRLRPRVGGKPFTNPAFEPHSETTVASTTATLEQQQQKCFSFTKVFPEGSSQEQLFQEVVQEPLHAFIEGTNVLLFAYGPTAGGKTHTMQGPCTDPGIVPRTLDRLFRLLGTQVCMGAPMRPDCFDDVVQLSAADEADVLQLKNELLGEKAARSAADFSTFHLPRNGSDASLFLSRSSTSSSGSPGRVLLWLSFYEIYNEGIHDLLLPSAKVPTKKATRRTLLKLGEDHEKRSFVRGLIEVPVHTADEAHRLLCLACHNRSIAETHLNRSSSRSHCVFTVRLVAASGEGNQDWHVSSLMLCDLAGSERPSKSGTDGSRLREAGRINTSLMVLSRCLEGLRRNKDAAKKVPVPFRESKLTKVMQAYFTTGGQVSLVVNVCPSMAMFEESLNALKFSAIASQVVPLQLEPRHERCRQVVRRLTEVWHTTRASAGEGLSANSVDSFVAVGPATLDPAETDELFDMVAALQQELDSTQKVLKWHEKMLSASRAEVADYKNLVAVMERTRQELRCIADEEMAIRVRNACEIARLDLYRRAKAGSTMELLGRCEKAERSVVELKKQLNEQSERHSAEERRQLGIAPLTDDTATQTDEGATVEQEVETQLAAAGVELEGLRYSLEEMASQLACEVQARRDAEDSAQQAHNELVAVSEELAEEVARSSGLEERIEQVQRDAKEELQHATSELGQELEQLRRHTREQELSLRKQLDDKDEVLRAVELSLRALKDNLEREVAKRGAVEVRCSKLTRELDDTTKSACEAKQSLQDMQSRLEKANAELSDCREELTARELSHKAAMELVEAKEEELRRLHQTASRQEEEPVPDENQHRPTRRTTRTTRKTSAATAKSSDGESDFKTPARTRPRRVKRPVAVSEDPLDDDEAVAGRRSVLADGNSESSPLKRLGEMVVGMFSRGTTNDGAASSTPASTRKTRRHQLLPADTDFVEVQDDEPLPSARKTTGHRRDKH